MAVANSDASSLVGGWSFRKDNLSRSLSHFVSLWDGDPTSIDRRNPEAPKIFFYQRRLTALIMGQVNVVEDLLFSQAAGNGFTARCLPSMDRERPKPPADTSMTPLERVGAPTVVRYDAVPISNGLTAEPVGSVRPVRAVGGVVQGHQGGPVGQRVRLRLSQPRAAITLASVMAAITATRIPVMRLDIGGGRPRGRSGRRAPSWRPSP